MEIEKEKLEILINESKSKSEICRKLGIHGNGQNFKKLDTLIIKYGFSLDVFRKNKNHILKYPVIVKICPVCDNSFETKSGSKEERETCSYGCANTHFRSGVNHSNYKDIGELTNPRTRTFQYKYREICFDNHKHECVVCGEDKLLDVHHFDGNKFNNEPSNLIPICATHHNYVHSKFKDLVIDKVINYRDKFIKNLSIGTVTNSKTSETDGA